MKPIISIIIIFSISFAGVKDFLNSDYENPNGQPFLVSIGIEKNINDFTLKGLTNIH